MVFPVDSLNSNKLSSVEQKLGRVKGMNKHDLSPKIEDPQTYRYSMSRRENEPIATHVISQAPRSSNSHRFSL